MNSTVPKLTAAFFCLLLAGQGVVAQSRHSSRTTDTDGTVVSVTAWRTDKKTDPIKLENLYLYENGVEQKIKGFS